jgi:anthranilate phosphoribosyltransferase
VIREAISKVIEGSSLSVQEAEGVMMEIMEGKATPAQIAAYVVGLRMKGETVEEITGSAQAMRQKAVRIRVRDRLVVDTCGTGGDRMGTFNISTTVAFLVSGAGITVAKHGNRSVSSSCGSADVLKALGVKIEIPPEAVEECINEIGIGFLFAPQYHGAMKHALAPRQEIGVRTLFNILGPLTNPAGATVQVLGVYKEELTDLLAQVLINLGSAHCFVVHGLDGLDEITITGKTRVSEGKEGSIKSYFLEPGDFDLTPAKIKDIQGGDMKENANIVLDILHGRKGPRREIVLLNAAPALVAAGKAKTLQDGYRLANESIDSGAAFEKLEALKEVTNR